MSRRTIRLIEQGSIDATEDEDEVRRWSQKRDGIVAKIRLLLDQHAERSWTIDGG
jgi:hypothetical protein